MIKENVVDKEKMDYQTLGDTLMMEPDVAPLY